MGVIPFISGRTLASAIQLTQARLPQRVTLTIHEGTSDALMPLLRDHTLDIVIGRASSTVDFAQLRFEVLYQQKPRLIASRRLAARLARARLSWDKLVELDWILGAPHTPMRGQIADIFLQAGVAPPVPMLESYTSRLIGEMIVANENAVSIVPADIAEELVHFAGVAIVPYTLDWTLPPVAMFTRAGVARELDAAFGQSLRELYQAADSGRGV